MTAAYDPFEKVRDEHKMFPATNAAAVTPSDTADLATVSRGIFIGTGGNLAITLKGNMAADTAGKVFKNVPSGTFFPFRVSRVWSTNTTAADIVVVW